MKAEDDNQLKKIMLKIDNKYLQETIDDVTIVSLEFENLKNY